MGKISRAFAKLALWTLEYYYVTATLAGGAVAAYLRAVAEHWPVVVTGGLMVMVFMVIILAVVRRRAAAQLHTVKRERSVAEHGNCTVFPDFGSVLNTPFGRTLNGTCSSFDIMALTARMCFRFANEIEAAIRRGVTFRLILPDYHHPDGMLAALATCLGIELALLQQEADKAESSINELARRAGASGKVQVKRMRAGLAPLHAAWIKDGETENAEAHVTTYYHRGDSYWPSFRASLSDSPAFVMCVVEEFSHVWDRCCR